MVKFDLTEKGYMKTEKTVNRTVITVFWAVFTIAASFLTFCLAWFLFANKQSHDPRDRYSFGATLSNSFTLIYFAFIVAGLTVYLVLTQVLMKSFCQNKPDGTSIRVKDTITYLPMCYCREALKPGQFILTYVASLFAVYLPLFIWWFVSLEVGSFITIFFVMIYIAPDMVLVFYILYIKLTKQAEYISVDDHIKITLYSKDDIWDRKTNDRPVIKAE